MATTHRTWNDPGVNPYLRCESPVTYRLSHGSVARCYILLAIVNRLNKHNCSDRLVRSMMDDDTVGRFADASNASYKQPH